ncbi:insulinase family protein [Flavobacteriales bacterium]|nr:insulinase family protein [Flavobacteriales bacterium]
MIQSKKFKLSNGLRVVYHRDESSPVAAFNMLYDVGARDENPNKTGFAHLFEHLMFGGSSNIPDFDGPLQMAGGQSNAFTSNDITNYYMTLPSVNLESAFWLESDRLNLLDFNQNSLDVQRKVVIEEFKQRYLNQPYGDVWLLLRPLCYKIHPYKWATIGEKIQHIEDAKIEDVRAFFFKHYTPRNSILSIAADLEFEKIQELADKWFGSIEDRSEYTRILSPEPIQLEKRVLRVERNVPNDALYIAFHMDNRMGEDYHVADLISDILSRGKSGRFYKKLIKDNPKFIELSAFIMGSLDNGLFVIAGKPVKGTSLDAAYDLIRAELDLFSSDLMDERELQKNKNKIKSSLTFQEMSNLNKAMSLAYYELFDSSSEINNEFLKYENVSSSDIKRVASKLFSEKNSNILYYKSIKDA